MGRRAIGKTSQALREGLDVRHKTVRPKKYIPKKKFSQKTSNTKKMQQNMGKDFVVETPKIREILHDDVPELTHEPTTNSFEPLFTFFPYTISDHAAKIIEAEYKKVHQIYSYHTSIESCYIFEH